MQLQQSSVCVRVHMLRIYFIKKPAEKIGFQDVVE